MKRRKSNMLKYDPDTILTLPWPTYIYILIWTYKEDEIVAVTTSDAIKKKLGLTKDTLVVIKSFDEKRNDMTVEGTLHCSHWLITLYLCYFIQFSCTIFVLDSTNQISIEISQLN